MSGGHGHGGGVRLSTLETDIANIFKDGDSSDALHEHLAHLSDADRAKLLVDLHTYRTVSPHHTGQIMAQGQQSYSELYTRVVKHMEHAHEGVFGFHPEVAKNASNKNRDMWARNVLDIALAHYVEKTKGKTEAQAKFAHVYDDGHGHDGGGHGEHGEHTKAKEYLLQKEREMIGDMLVGEQGGYKKLLRQLKLSKNVVEDLKNEKHPLHGLFLKVAENTTDYAMRGIVVDRALEETYDGNPDLIGEVGVARFNEWGGALGHDYGMNAKYITDFETMKKRGTQYLQLPISASKEAGKHGEDAHLWVPLKEEHAEGGNLLQFKKKGGGHDHGNELAHAA